MNFVGVGLEQIEQIGGRTAGREIYTDEKQESDTLATAYKARKIPWRDGYIPRGRSFEITHVSRLAHRAKSGHEKLKDDTVPMLQISAPVMINIPRGMGVTSSRFWQQN